MNLNVLKPGAAVSSAFEQPNPGLALLLVLVACGVIAGQILFLGFPLKIVDFAINVVVMYYIYFFILAVLLYIAAFILKGREAVTGRFAGIVSALGLLQLPIIIGLIIYTAAIPAIFSPLALELVRDVATGESTGEILAIQVNYLIENDVELVNFGTLYIFVPLLLLIALFNLFLLYKIVSKLFQYRILGNIIVMVVILIILGLIPL